MCTAQLSVKPVCAATHWFDDPLLFAPAVLPRSLEQLQVKREHIRLREESKLLLSEVQLHLTQVAPQSVFPANLEGAWEMVQLK